MSDSWLGKRVSTPKGPGEVVQDFSPVFVRVFLDNHGTAKVGKMRKNGTFKEVALMDTFDLSEVEDEN